jgi:hypothetical protein
LLLGAHAHAAPRGGFVELNLGVSIPEADEDWADAVNTSPKLGARFGVPVGRDRDVAFEVTLDLSPLDLEVDSVPGVDVDLTRFRVLAGARWQRATSRDTQWFFRAAAGLDVLRVHISGDVGPISFDDSDTDTGLVIEPGIGIVHDLGSVALGGQLALPFAFHDDDDDGTDFDTDFTSVDIELLFTVQWTL